MHWRSALRSRSFCALAGTLAGCAQADEHESPAFSWPESATVAPEGQIFAASFRDSAEASFLRLSIHPYDGKRACEEYAKDDIADGVFLRLETNAYREGTFAVVPRLDPESPRLQAEVALIDSRAGVKRHRIAAAGGVLEVSAILPSGIRGSVRAEFASDPLHKVECRSDISKDGRTHASCTCETLSGKSYTCVRESFRSDCCVSPEPSDISISFDIAAAACRELCVVADPSVWHLCVNAHPSNSQ